MEKAVSYPSQSPLNLKLALLVGATVLASQLLTSCGTFYPKAKEENQEGTNDPIPTAINAWDKLVSKSYNSGANVWLVKPRSATVVVTPKAEIVSKTAIMYRLAVPMTATLSDGTTKAFDAAAEFKLKGKMDLTFSTVGEFSKEGDCRYDLKRSLGRCALTSSKKDNAWQVDQPYTVALALRDAAETLAGESAAAGESTAAQWRLIAKVSDASGAEIASAETPLEALAGITSLEFAGSLNAAILSYKDYPDCTTVPASGFKLATPTMQVAEGQGEQPLKLGDAAVHGMCKTKAKGVTCTDDGCTLELN